MQECPKCNTKWPADHKFCARCGASLRTEPKAAEHAHTAERRHAVVVFADIQGYTSLSANLDPEEIHELMQPIYSMMGETVAAHGGTVAKFIGDCAMALFGTPKAHENDEIRAICCALEMHRRMAEYPEVHGRKLRLTIGINSGLVVAGDIGGAHKFDFDALGDTVNVAARLQGKADAGQVFVSDRVYRRARPQFEWEPVGPFELKNVPRPVQAYNVLAQVDPAEVAKFVGAGMAKLCGRDPEMRKTDELLSTVAGGSGRVLGITGEAGVGKSRLVYELCNRAEDLGFQILIGRTLSYGQNMPLWPVKEIVRLFSGLREHDKKDVAQERIRSVFSRFWTDDKIREIRVTTLAWFLGYSFPGSTIEKIEGEGKKNLLEATLNEFFLSLAKEKPLVLVLEDMHWTDPTTRDWVVQFARIARKKPILIVLAYRPGFEYDWSKEPRITFEEIALKPITPDHIGVMVLSTLGVDDAPFKLARFVADKSQGNPFFAEEIIKHLLESGIVVKEVVEGDIEIRITKPLESVDIPSSIQALVLSRVDRIETETRRTLQEASVIGEAFLEKVLEEISSAREQLRENLSNLTRFELIYQQSRIPEIEYMFKHILVRDAVYETLLKSERRKLHLAAADAIERLFPDRLEDFYALLAHHLGLAGETEKEVEYLMKEAERLEKTFNYREALGYFESVANKTGDEDTRNKALVRMLRLNRTLWQSKNVKKILDELNSKELTGTTRALFHLNRGQLLWPRHREVEALEDFELARELSEKSGDKQTLVQALLWKGHFIRFRDVEAALDLWKKCQKMSEDIGDKTGLADVLSFIAWAYDEKGETETALKLYEEIVKIAQDTGNRWQEAAQLQVVGRAHWLNRQDYEKALLFLRKSLEIYEELGHWMGVINVFIDFAEVYEAKSSLDEALECYEKGLKLTENADDRSVLRFLFSVGRIHFKKGQSEVAQEYFDRGLKLSEKTGETAWLLGKIGTVHTRNGDYETAMKYCKDGMDLNPDEPQCWYNLACVYAIIGEKEKALLELEKVLQVDKSSSFRQFVKKNPDLESLHDEPEFKRLVSKNNPDFEKKEEE